MEINRLKLENYDGIKAYLDTEKYSIIKYKDKIYAFPADVEIMAIHLGNDEAEKSKANNKYPLLLVTSEDLPVNQAVASRIQPDIKLLERILTERLKE